MANTRGCERKVEAFGKRLLADTVEELCRQLDAVVPVGEDDPLGRRRGGQLKASRKVSVRGLRARIAYPVPQALYTDQGTVPHRIRARRAPRLVFYWKRTGRVMYVIEVHHPGNRGTRWWSKVVAPANVRRIMAQRARHA